MPPIHFLKITGTGNDFIMIDNRKRCIDADHCQDPYCCRRVRVTSLVEGKTRGGDALNIHFELARGPRNDIQLKEVYLEGEARVVYEADFGPKRYSSPQLQEDVKDD
jgi:hypothetical protein